MVGGGGVDIQSASLEMTTLNSSDAHPKRRSQFLSSVASAPSAPAAPESFDTTHITSSSVKSRGAVSRISSYYSKADHMGFSTGWTRVSGCFSRRTSATGRPVFVHWSSGRRHPPPSLSVAQCTDCLSLPENTMLWYLWYTASSSSSSPLVDLPSLASPSASTSPTRPAWRPLYQRSIRLVIHAWISLALRTPNVFMRTTWEKNRGISDFQVLLSTPRHYSARMAVNWRPTAPKGMAYQLTDCAASRCQQRYQIALSVTPPSRCKLFL